jgi:hypothetical protein
VLAAPVLAAPVLAAPVLRGSTLGGSEALGSPCLDDSAVTDSRGRADDIRLISAGALPISLMIEHRFVYVKSLIALYCLRFFSYSDF